MTSCEEKGNDDRDKHLRHDVDMTSLRKNGARLMQTTIAAFVCVCVCEREMNECVCVCVCWCACDEK